jgi:two-component system, sensor histidine kinase LadS
MITLGARALRFVLCCALVCASLVSYKRASAQDALPQNPSLVATLPSSALGQRQLSTIDLNAKINHVDISALTEFWVDDALDTQLDPLLARATAGIDLFKPSQSTDSHRVQGKVLWLRFEVKMSDPRSRWLLELRSPLVDDVQLHWRDASNQWMVLKAGDAVARSQWPLQTRMPTFMLAEREGYVQYYLRVQNARAPVSLPMHIYRDNAFLGARQLDLLFLGGFIGLVGLMLITSIAMAVLRRERAFAAYSVYLVTLGMFILTNTGLTSLFFWNESPILAERLNYVWAGLAAAIGPLLVRIVIQPGLRNNLFDVVLSLHLAIMLSATALELFMPSMTSYRILNLGTMASIGIVYAFIVIAWQRGEKITRWLAISFAPVALSAIPLILRNFGLIPNSWLTSYAPLIANSLEIPLLLYALSVRSNARRESLARAAGLPSQDALTGLPNMRHFLQQLHGSIIRANRFDHPYGLLLVELCNHTWFTKEHGREMADRALILTSTRLQQQLRDVDSVCRLDESQFVILVEGACSPAQLTKLAARISASGHAPTEILPVGASLRLSVCCALMPTPESSEAGEDAQAQLGWLIAATEGIPPEQRKLVRSIGF